MGAVVSTKNPAAGAAAANEAAVDCALTAAGAALPDRRTEGLTAGRTASEQSPTLATDLSRKAIDEMLSGKVTLDLRYYERIAPEAWRGLLRPDDAGGLERGPHRENLPSGILEQLDPDHHSFFRRIPDGVVIIIGRDTFPTEREIQTNPPRLVFEIDPDVLRRILEREPSSPPAEPGPITRYPSNGESPGPNEKTITLDMANYIQLPDDPAHPGVDRFKSRFSDTIIEIDRSKYAPGAMLLRNPPILTYHYDPFSLSTRDCDPGMSPRWKGPAWDCDPGMSPRMGPDEDRFGPRFPLPFSRSDRSATEMIRKLLETKEGS